MLAAVGAQGQTKAKAPRISIDAKAKGLLDKATATYKTAKGLRYDQETLVDGKTLTHTRVSFARPNRVRVDNLSSQPVSPLWIMDGQNLHGIMTTGIHYSKEKAPVSGVQFLRERTLEGQFLADMLSGKSPFDPTQASFKDAPPFKGRLDSLSPRTVDGELCSGIKLSLFSPASGDDGGPQSLEVTMWFGKRATLNRTQGIVRDEGKTSVSRTRLWNQQLNPTFAPNTWKFDPTGLRPAFSPGDKPRFDPRLTWGAEPFAFEAKSVDGQTISLDAYKGKVLLLDFWATWCGPCVAQIPEIQATYNKYHAQGLEVVGISLDRNEKDLTSFIKARKLPWPQVFDSRDKKVRLSKLYGVTAIPFLLLIGRDGKIEAVNPRNDLEGAVKRALAAK